MLVSDAQGPPVGPALHAARSQLSVWRIECPLKRLRFSALQGYTPSSIPLPFSLRSRKRGPFLFLGLGVSLSFVAAESGASQGFSQTRLRGRGLLDGVCENLHL